MTRQSGRVARGAVVLCTLVLAAGPAAVSAQPYGYITNSVDDTVSVIDTASDTVIATVSVGRFPGGVAVSPDATRVYVSNGGDGTVSVIDTAGNAVVATIPVGYAPGGIIVSPDGAQVYVARGSIPGSVFIIDTATNRVIDTRPAGDQPMGIAVHPSGRWVYVASTIKVQERRPCDFAGDFFCDVPVVTFAPGIPGNHRYITDVGDNLTAVAVHPDGTEVYVANEVPPPWGTAGPSGVISILAVGLDPRYPGAPDLVGRIVLDLPGDEQPGNGLGGPWALAIKPDGTRLYVSHAAFDVVTVVDLIARRALTRIPVGAGPQGVAITPDGRRLYVVNTCGTTVPPAVCKPDIGTVSVIDTATNTVIDTITVGRQPVAFGQFIQPVYLDVTPRPTPTPTVTAGESCRESCQVGTGCRRLVGALYLSGTCTESCECYVETPTPGPPRCFNALGTPCPSPTPTPPPPTPTRSCVPATHPGCPPPVFVEVCRDPFDRCDPGCFCAAVTPTPPTPTPVPACIGDCNRDGVVSVDELVLGVNIALGQTPVDRCAALDINGDKQVSVDELVAAVGAAINGCPAHRTGSR